MGLHAHAPQINFYTHGTQITASHGHLAFYGAYAVIVLAMASYAVPNLRKTTGIITHQKQEIFAFWTMAVLDDLHSPLVSPARE